MIQGQALAGILTSVLAIVPTLIFKEDIENLEGKTVQVVKGKSLCYRPFRGLDIIFFSVAVQ